MASESLSQNWKIFDSIKKCRVKKVKISDLNTKKHKPAEDVFFHNQTKRRLLKNMNRFQITAKSDVDEIYINSAEVNADAKVNNKEIPLVDRDGCVFIGHDAVALAKKRGDDSIVVLQFEDDLDESDRMAVTLRRLSRNNALPTMARIELIRVAKDELNFDFNLISELMVGKKGKKSVTEVVSEYNASKIYAEFAGHQTPFGKRGLDDSCFSKIKFLGGRTDIRDLMDSSKEIRESFVNIAINSTASGEKRFQDSIPKMMKFSDTRDALLRGEFLRAKHLLSLNHPETTRASFPLLDAQSVYNKLFDPETLKVIVAQAENANGASEFTAVLGEIMSLVCNSSPKARQFFLKQLKAQGVRVNKGKNRLHLGA